MGRPGIRSRSEDGFVLYEALIALVLTVSMLALFTTALSLGRRVADADRARGQIGAATAAANTLLSWLGSAVNVPLAEGRSEVFFFGRANGLKFATLSNAETQIGGLVAIEIVSAPDRGATGSAQAVVFRSWPIDPDARVDPASIAARAETLFKNIAGLEFSYYGSKDGRARPSWHQEWLAANSLPRNVLLRLALHRNGSLLPLEFNFRLHSR